MTTPVQPAQSPPAPRRAPRWLIAAAAVWALLLAGGGYWSARHDEATVREQRSVDEAVPVVNRAVGAMVAAAGPDAVVEIGAPRLTAGCRLTAARDGATLEQDVRIFAPPGEAPARLDTLAGRLPEAYRAWVRHGAARVDHTLRADAGEFVGVRGGVTEPGVITLTAATGCRPDGDTALGDTLRRAPDELVAAAGRTAAALGFEAPVGDIGWSPAACPGGDTAVTVRAAGRPGTMPDPLPPALRTELAGAAVELETAELVAYRRPDGVGIVSEVSGDMVTVTATRACRGQ